MPSLEFRIFAWVDVPILVFLFGIPMVFGVTRFAFERLFRKDCPKQKFLRNSRIDKCVLSLCACGFFVFDVVNGFRTSAQCANSSMYRLQTENLIGVMFDFIDEVPPVIFLLLLPSVS